MIKIHAAVILETVERTFNSPITAPLAQSGPHTYETADTIDTRPHVYEVANHKTSTPLVYETANAIDTRPHEYEIANTRKSTSQVYENFNTNGDPRDSIIEDYENVES